MLRWAAYSVKFECTTARKNLVLLNYQPMI